MSLKARKGLHIAHYHVMSHAQCAITYGQVTSELNVLKCTIKNSTASMYTAAKGKFLKGGKLLKSFEKEEIYRISKETYDTLICLQSCKNVYQLVIITNTEMES